MSLLTDRATDGARCDLTDLLTRDCAHCRGLDETVQTGERHNPDHTGPATEASGQVLAQYEGRCPACDDPIQPGDPIVAINQIWLCSGCGDGIHTSATGGMR